MPSFSLAAAGVIVSLALAACDAPNGVAAVGAQATSAGVPGDTFSFGLWGDMPYKKAGDAPKLPAMLQSINASDIAFSLYDGDIKDGSSKCGNGIYTDALAMFNSMKKPVVYIPGDNEWTDCHRRNNGGMDPLERLAHIRRVMYASPGALGQQTMPLMHQGKPGEAYVENTRFEYGSVVFAGFNMPGSNNNHIATDKQCTAKSKRTPADCAQAEAEYLARDAANRRWLAETFAQAQANSAKGVVIVVQAEPSFDVADTKDGDASQSPETSGYRPFMAALTAETARFAGQVLFVHGDKHEFKADKPLRHLQQPLGNFTRVETFGSPSLHWVKVTVDPASAAVFQIEPVMVKHGR